MLKRFIFIVVPTLYNILIFLSSERKMQKSFKKIEQRFDFFKDMCYNYFVNISHKP